MSSGKCEIRNPKSGRPMGGFRVSSFALRVLCILMGSVLSASAAAQSESIVNSPHNLSASGPGGVRATSEQQICIFCHTPHNAVPVQPLWNRQTPVSAYRVYSSNSLQALPGQPTGSSKLCLSCHDGTIALGSVTSRQQPIQMAGGMTTLAPGKSNLGTDLSDDHPISFRYDTALVAKSPKLKSPSSLPPGVRLDANQELQCTSCHDSHSNRFGKFLAMDNSSSQLCNSCHQQGATTVATHIACASCHQPHTAPSGPYLLKGQNVTRTCIACHSTTPSPTKGADIASDLAKPSRHDTDSAVNLKDHIPNNIDCNDCHEGHTMSSASAMAPLVSPRLGRVAGIAASGARVPQAQYEYEVCFKCHGDQATAKVKLPTRQIVQINTRLQFAPSAVSYHPVEVAGRNTDVPSLIAPLTISSIIYCTDCHASDSGEKAGGIGPNGPHGSNNRMLLIARYETTDNTPESTAAYALCYRCHDRNSILQNASFPEHKLHVVDKTVPCSVCHDSHGIGAGQGTMLNNSHLINFDKSIVQADPTTKRLEYISSGIRSGRCFVSCHNIVHSGTGYGNTAPLAPMRGRQLIPKQKR